MRSIVVGLAGAIASGKTSVALELANTIQCPIASFGQYVRDAAIRRGLGTDREVLQKISEELIASFGPQGLTKKVLESAMWDREHSLVVDGVRHPTVVEALTVEVSPIPFILVYLEVRFETRQERLVARDNLSSSHVKSFELHSTEREVGTRVRGLADIIVTADGQIADTLAEVMKPILSELQFSNVRKAEGSN